MTTIQQIKSIINPVRVLKVEDWMKVANILTESHTGLTYDSKVDYGSAERDWMLRRDAKIVQLISRYESLTSQPLKKEHFVCEVEKPKKVESFKVAIGESDEYANKLINLYQAAQAKLFFEGFEEVEALGVPAHKVRHIESGFTVLFRVGGAVRISESSHNYEIITISDICYIITRYNSTAKEPIKLFWKENFINQLIK